MINLSHAIKETDLNSRICPIPEVWQKIYDMLPDKIVGEYVNHPVAMPEFKSDSCRTSLFLCLRLDFREHLDWASTHGVIEEVYHIIHNLPEEQWLHHGDTIILPQLLHKPPVPI
jgi:hypothetical protein